MNRKAKFSGFLIVSLFAIILNACNMRGPQLPTWLEGTWATNDTIGLVAESWEKINNDFMSGEGLFVTTEDKTVIEILSIFIQDGNLYYAALLPDQNEGAEIIFMATHMNPDSLVFENPKHDYPKKIIYHKLDTGSVEVSIYGNAMQADKVLLLMKVEE